MVITLNIGDYNVHCILVDSECLIDIIFYDAFLKINIFLEWLKKLDMPITKFLRESIPSAGTVTLLVIVGSVPQ